MDYVYCHCHFDGDNVLSEIFWWIRTRFMKIFNIDPICEDCGKRHYE